MLRPAAFRPEQRWRAFQKEHPPQEIPGTKLTTVSAWGQVLEHLKQPMTVTNYKAWLGEVTLVLPTRAAL